MKQFLQRLFGRAASVPAPQACMSTEDAAVVVAFARGDRSLRERAVAIHRKWIDQIGVRGTPEQDFMAEIDNPVPDFALRDMYRKKLLAEADTSHAVAPSA